MQRALCVWAGQGVISAVSDYNRFDDDLFLVGDQHQFILSGLEVAEQKIAKRVYLLHGNGFSPLTEVYLSATQAFQRPALSCGKPQQHFAASSQPVYLQTDHHFDVFCLVDICWRGGCAPKGKRRLLSLKIWRWRGQSRDQPLKVV